MGPKMLLVACNSTFLYTCVQMYHVLLKHERLRPWFNSLFSLSLFLFRVCCHIPGYTQKNGAVSKVNKKFISHLTRAQRTPSAAATVQVSHALQAVRFSCLLRGCGASFQDGVVAGKGFLCAPFWGVQICDYSAAWVSCSTVITDLDTSKRSTQKAFSCYDAILENCPAVSMRSELLVAHEKLGQLPLLTVYVVPV